MKVLFAVKSQTISETIINRYRKEYQEIITYKNVYYFNAILTEIQNNKDYDRIIISEDLEPFANNNNYDTIDKFIFEKLDSISDEANDSNGNEIVILFLCSERRQKGNELLSKLFSIGIYNAILGDDRSVSGVCKLIREPRTKKDAKNYYKIDSDTSNYRPERENEVSEVEIQNILNHFRKLGKETEKYVASFDNIAAQYTEEQLKIIANCLPIKVKNILAASSEKYKKLAANTFGLGSVNNNRYEEKPNAKGVKIDTLSGAASRNKINKPIVIPSGVKKVTSKKNISLEDTPSSNSGIKVQRKPSSLQEQIERRTVEEVERKEALRKQKVLEEKEQGIKKTEVEAVKKDKLDEIPNKKNIKNTEIENNVDEELDMFLPEDFVEDIATEKTKKMKSTVKNDLEEDDIFGEDFEELEELEIEESKETKLVEENNLEEDDIFGEDFEEFEELEDLGIEESKETKLVEEDELEDNDIFGEDFEEFEELEDLGIEESKETKLVEENELEEDEVFGEDFDEFADFEDIEIEEPKESKPTEKSKIEEDDIFAEDFDEFADFEDIEIEEPKESKPIEKSKIEEDDIFAEDFDEFSDFEDIEIEEPKESKPKEKSKIEEDDIFAEDFDEFGDFEDIEIEEPKESKTKEKSKIEEDDIFAEDFDGFGDFEDIEIEEPKSIKSIGNGELEESFDDIFGEEATIPALDDLDDDIFEEESKTAKPEIEEDEDIFGEEATIPALDDLDDDIFEEESKTAKSEIEEDEDIFGEEATIPALDDLDDDIFEEESKTAKPEIEEDEDIFGEEATIPALDDLDDDIFEEESKTAKPEMEEDEDIFGEEATIPGLDDLDDDIFEEKTRIVKPEIEEDEDIFGAAVNSNISVKNSSDSKVESIKSSVQYSVNNLNKLLTKEKKIVNFIGTTKNGTSFLVNNLAKMFSSIGINTAILDLTTNKNSYYIFTNSDDRLRKIASTSFDKLEKGYAEGIKVDKNLTVYTAIPNTDKKIYNAENILSTLVQNHSLILVDCDYSTDYAYFALCQEMYLVQSMDILTMQPLTTFLRELQVRNILESEKIRVVINKELKVRDLNPKAIIGGMSCYKDPGMSVMVKLFNKDMVQACSIPFEENTYSKYLEAMVNCEISLSGYSKNFMAKLKNLGDMIYPLNSKPSYSSGPIAQNYKTTNTFSNDMNKTLNQMKKKY